MITKAGKYFFIAFMLLSFGFAANAQRMRVIVRDRPAYYTPVQQRPFEGQLKVRKLKEEFISKMLLLSPDQTNRFLIVFRRYEQERGAVRVLKNLNNTDASKNGADQLNKDADYDRQLLEIRDKYRQEFLKIMPPEKVSVIYKAEYMFNQEVERMKAERTAPPATLPGH